MHGLLNKGLERFLADTYGPGVWSEIAVAAELPTDGFEALLTYELELTHKVLREASARLGKSTDTLLEDLGTYLVSDQKMDPMRRLLRFGGTDFPDFVESLVDLPERIRLAVPDLIIPDIIVTGPRPDAYRITLSSEFGRFGRILAGLLRAMADDYGCLSLIEWTALSEMDEAISVILLDGAFAQPKAFALSAEAQA